MSANAVDLWPGKIRCTIVSQNNRRRNGAVAAGFEPGSLPGTTALKQNAVARSVSLLVGASNRLPWTHRTKAVVIIAANLAIDVVSGRGEMCANEAQNWE